MRNTLISSKMLFLIQARSGSTRLPKKVLIPFFNDQSILDIILTNLTSKVANAQIVVLTTVNADDFNIVKIAEKHGVRWYRGDEKNVLSRFYNVLSESSSEYFFRICADNPFLNVDLMLNMLEYANKVDYISYMTKEGVPGVLSSHGIYAELIRSSAFLKMAIHSTDVKTKEHVTPQFYQSSNYNVTWLTNEEVNFKSFYRLTVDTKNDFDLSKNLYKSLENRQSLKELSTIIENTPSIQRIMLNENKKNKK